MARADDPRFRRCAGSAGGETGGGGGGFGGNGLVVAADGNGGGGGGHALEEPEAGEADAASWPRVFHYDPTSRKVRDRSIDRIGMETEEGLSAWRIVSPSSERQWIDR